MVRPKISSPSSLKVWNVWAGGGGWGELKLFEFCSFLMFQWPEGSEITLRDIRTKYTTHTCLLIPPFLSLSLSLSLALSLSHTHTHTHTYLHIHSLSYFAPTQWESERTGQHRLMLWIVSNSSLSLSLSLSHSLSLTHSPSLSLTHSPSLSLISGYRRCIFSNPL